jgi:putative acetyltransferase
VEVTIRAYEQRDAADLAEVFFRSVRQVAISDYTPAQVSAWAPERRTAEWSHQWASDGRLVLLATNENDRAVAFIDLEPDGHIDHIFCAPEAAGQGIASQLYEATETAGFRTVRPFRYGPMRPLGRESLVSCQDGSVGDANRAV